MLGAVVGLSVWQAVRLREPVYQGRGLSYWLDGPHREKRGYLDDRARQAIRHMGTNALPVLYKRLRAQDSPLKQRVMQWAQKQAVIPFRFRSVEQRRSEAIWGYEALGPLASAQVPSLSATLTNDPSPRVRMAAAWALAHIRPEARMAAPALFRAAQDTDYRVRGPAFLALGRIRPDPELAVPLLVAGLDDPLPTVRANAANALRSYGPQAKAAVPTLLRMLSTNNGAVFQQDTNVHALHAISAGNAAGFEKGVVGAALKEIDSKAAARVGVQ